MTYPGDIRLSVVIPTYNEAGNVGLLLEALDSVLDGDSEVVIVDDSSPDGTAERVRDLDSKPGNTRIISREDKKGVGSALVEGFMHSEGEIVVQMDADLSHSPRDIGSLVSALEEGADVAIGSRYIDGGDRMDPGARQLLAGIGIHLYRVLLSMPVRDVTSGFKAYRREALEDVDFSEMPDGYAFQVESLYSHMEKGHEIVERSITFHPRFEGRTKYGFGNLLRNFRSLLRLVWKKRSL